MKAQRKAAGAVQRSHQTLDTTRPARRQAWIGLVTLVPIQPPEQRWTDRFGDATGGVVYAVAYATSGREYKRAVRRAAADFGARVEELEEVEPIHRRTARETVSEEINEILASLRRSKTPTFGTVYSYYSAEESESLPHSELLERLSKRPSLTPLQKRIVRELARMLTAVKLPLLDEVYFETEDGHVAVNMATEADGGTHLQVAIDRADEIVVDYLIGHTHFRPLGASDYAADALDFIYSAIQGGVKVEVWESGGQIERTRTMILADEATWVPCSRQSTSDGATFDEAPSYSVILSFIDEQSPAWPPVPHRRRGHPSGT